MHLRRIIATVFVGLALAQPARGQAVDITVEQFGLAGNFRPGWLVPVRLKLVSHLVAPTPVWVQWQVPNADGDVGEYGRSLTLTPNVPAFAWLYAPLPPDTLLSSIWTVRIFEERDGVRRGEIDGGTRISPVSSGAIMVNPEQGLVAVVGRSPMGLNDYSLPQSVRNNAAPPAHEDTVVITGLSPEQLPDRWEGLRPCEALAWGGDREPPTDLSLDQATAIREYVRNGGHFIVVLPAAGNPWGLGTPGQNQLEDLLPSRAPRKDDAVPARSLATVLSKSDLAPANLEVSVRVFKDLKGDFNSIDNHFDPLISLSDGRVVAIQRTFGHGRVTVIGIDLADGRLNGLGWPHGDAFWNRILGRRADTPTPDELRRTEESNRLARGPGSREVNLGSGSMVTSRIHRDSEVGLGLLLSFVLFVSYWLLAGPGGFLILKHYQKTHLAWLAFAACAAAFTVLAWGSVGLIPKAQPVAHVTVLDHVARPPDDLRTEEPQYQKAVSFFSVYLPSYSPTRVEIVSTPGNRDLLSSWSPPGVGRQLFPNVSRYQVDVGRMPANFLMPARSTTTQMYAHWQGALDPRWGGMLSVDPNDPIRVLRDGSGKEDTIAGTIINNLPGTLTNVTVIWIKNQRPVQRRYDMTTDSAGARLIRPWVPYARSGESSAIGSVWRPSATQPWTAGSANNLAVILGASAPLETNLKGRYFDHYNKESQFGAPTVVTDVSDNDRRNYLEMLSIFQQMVPPKYLLSSDKGSADPFITMHRELGRELDLSAWFVRPCVMVLGYLEDSACPVPLRIDGESEAPRSTGLTMVRWVYPLPVDEKIAFGEVFEPEPTP